MPNRTEKLELVRDVLDKLLLDREGNPLGRVDGIVIVFSSDAPQPRVAQIESGVATLARRLDGRLARGLQRIGRKFGIRWHRPVRVPWSRVEINTKELRLDILADNSRLLEGERWLRNHIVRRIPGNGMRRS